MVHVEEDGREVDFGLATLFIAPLCRLVDTLDNARLLYNMIGGLVGLHPESQSELVQAE